MKNYKGITIFENTRRKTLIVGLKKLIIGYLNSQERDFLTNEPKETEKSLVFRAKINEILIEVREYVMATGVNPYANITYSPIGMKGPVDFLANIFSFQRVSFNQDHFMEIIDMLDRAVGVYLIDRNRALVRTFNPFFWLGRLLDFVTRLPFIFFGKLIGVDHAKLEAHLFGRIFKIVERVILVAFAVLGILDILDYIAVFKEWIIRLFR